MNRKVLLKALLVLTLFALSRGSQAQDTAFDCQRLDILPTDRRVMSPPTVRDLAVSSDGAYLVAVSNNHLLLYEVDSLTSVSIDGLTAQPATSFAWSANNLKIAVANENLGIWDFDKGEYSLVAEDVSSYQLKWSSNGQYIAGLSYSGLYVWDVLTHELVGTLYEQSNPYSTVNPTTEIEWKPNSSLLTITVETSVFLWDVTSQDPPAEIIRRDPAHIIFTFAWSPDGSTLALPDLISAGIELWKSDSWQFDQRLTPYLGNFVDLSWSKNGDQIAVGVQNTPGCTLFVWLLDGAIPTLSAIGTNPGLISALTWTPDDRFLFSALMDGTIYKWEVSSSRLFGVIQPSAPEEPLAAF
jgi:WD40 repeat protein